MKQNKKVTDSALLEKLEGRRVKDPSVLAQLNSDSGNEEDYGSYLDKLPQPEGFLSKLPRNILIGLTHAGRNLHNMPHDIVKGFEGGTEGIRKAFDILPGNMPSNVFGESSKKPFSEYLPNDEQDYSDIYGQKGDPTLMDSVIQKALEHGSSIAGGAGLIRSGLRKFPITQRAGSRQLREAEGLVKSMDVPNIPLSNQLIDESMQFLPKTRASKEMLRNASRGEYSPSFSLQSQLGHHERALRKSPLASERLQAPKARELKEMALQEMETGLRSHGYDEIADLMKGGLNDYRKYIKFRDEVKPIIKKIGIPTSMLAFIGIGKEKGKKIASKLID